MAKLETDKTPAIVRVQTQERAEEIMSICEQHDWKIIVGIEPNKAENISDVERLLNPAGSVRAEKKINRNASCPCGSGKKY